MSQSGKVKVSITKVKKEAQSQGEGERVMREGIVQMPKWAESPTNNRSSTATSIAPVSSFYECDKRAGSGRRDSDGMPKGKSNYGRGAGTFGACGRPGPEWAHREGERNLSYSTAPKYHWPRLALFKSLFTTGADRVPSTARHAHGIRPCVRSLLRSRCPRLPSKYEFSTYL